MNSGVLALIGTLFGAVGLKVIEYWLGRNKEKFNMDLAMRDELRQELIGVKSELNNTRKELDDWKIKYFEGQQKLNAALVELALIVGKAKDEVDDA